MGEMAAVGQIHAQHRVAWLEHGLIGSVVCLRAAVRLHIGVLSAEKLLDAFARQVFDDVDVFAAAVIALARIAFGVFVRQAGALRRHHSAAGKVFRSDQLDLVALTLEFMGDRLRHSRILRREEFGDITHS